MKSAKKARSRDLHLLPPSSTQRQGFIPAAAEKKVWIRRSRRYTRCAEQKEWPPRGRWTRGAPARQGAAATPADARLPRAPPLPRPAGPAVRMQAASEGIDGERMERGQEEATQLALAVPLILCSSVGPLVRSGSRTFTVPARFMRSLYTKRLALISALVFTSPPHSIPLFSSIRPRALRGQTARSARRGPFTSSFTRSASVRRRSSSSPSRRASWAAEGYKGEIRWHGIPPPRRGSQEGSRERRGEGGEGEDCTICLRSQFVL